MNDEPQTMVERELITWPGVSATRGRFASTAFLYGKREIGHIHRNGVADLPFPRAVHDELIAAGRAQAHQAGVAGFVSVPIRSRDDVPAVLALFRMNHERATESAARRAAPQDDTTDLRTPIGR